MPEMVREPNFKDTWSATSGSVQEYLTQHVDSMADQSELGLFRLKSAYAYTLLNGGKRFRSVLALWVAKTLGWSERHVLPYAAAIEMIHTYSLIHDDLPCMDNDLERRGKPSNHLVFGEDYALLAGDALLTEAFGIVSRSYLSHDQGMRVISEMSRLSGVGGMIGGQAIDLLAQKEGINRTRLERMHRLKTGALIRAAVVGSALLCRANAEEESALAEYAENLGLAFQIVDDIQDSAEVVEPGSYIAVVGPEETQNLLKEVSERAESALKQVAGDTSMLSQVIEYNRTRLD